MEIEMTETENTNTVRQELATAAVRAFADMMAAMAGPIAARAALERIEHGEFAVEVSVTLPSCDVAVVAVTRDGRRLDVANLVSAARTSRN
jgi:hypothetical protein